MAKTITKYLMLVMLILAFAAGGSEGRFHLKPLTKAQDIATSEGRFPFKPLTKVQDIPTSFVGTQFDVRKVHGVGTRIGKFKGHFKVTFGPMRRP